MFGRMSSKQHWIGYRTVNYRRARTMQSEKANKDILQLGTEMDTKNPLIGWYIYRFHCLVQRKRCPRMIQTTRLVYHILVKPRRDLARLTVVHRPYRPNHRTIPNELHRRREVDHLVRALFVPDRRMTCREIRKFGVLQIAPDDPLDGKVSIMQSKRVRNSILLHLITITLSRTNLHFTHTVTLVHAHNHMSYACPGLCSDSVGI